MAASTRHIKGFSQLDKGGCTVYISPVRMPWNVSQARQWRHHAQRCGPALSIGPQLCSKPQFGSRLSATVFCWPGLPTTPSGYGRRGSNTQPGRTLAWFIGSICTWLHRRLCLLSLFLHVWSLLPLPLQGWPWYSGLFCSFTQSWLDQRTFRWTFVLFKNT